MPAYSTLKRSGPGLGPIESAFRRLTKTRLLVGIPGDAPPRKPEPGEKRTPPPNGVIGYLMEFGDDEMHLPARPFLVPGVRAAMPEITAGFHQALVDALSGRPGKIKAGFDRAGLAAVGSVKMTMQTGPFAPLSERTIEQRARRKSAETGRLRGDGRSRDARDYLKLQKEGTPDWALQGAGFARPLLDTFSLYKSVTYIVEIGN